MSRFLAAVAAAPMLAAAFGAAAEPIVINVASTFPGSMPVLGEVSRGLPQKIARASGGEVVLKFHEPGKLVPGADTVNAVSRGEVAAAWAGAGWFADKDSAFNIFSSVPFGPGMGEYMAWLYRGGGLEAAREMFARYNVYNIPCGMIPPEASGWFRKEIKRIDDLKGLKMRFFGLGAGVMRKFGVATQQLPPGEILEALKSGALDATEFSLPAMDQPLGFYKVAKYYYWPGFHEPGAALQCTVNTARFEALPADLRQMIQVACGRENDMLLAEFNGRSAPALGSLVNEHGVILKQFPKEVLIAFGEASGQLMQSIYDDGDDITKRICQSFFAFRRDIRLWTRIADQAYTNARALPFDYPQG